MEFVKLEKSLSDPTYVKGSDFHYNNMKKVKQNINVTGSKTTVSISQLDVTGSEAKPKNSIGVNKTLNVTGPATAPHLNQWEVRRFETDFKNSKELNKNVNNIYVKDKGSNKVKQYFNVKAMMK